MKILYITLENLSLHKGSVVHIREIVGGLRRRGHHVEVIDNSHRPFFFSKILGIRRELYVFFSFFLFFHLIKVLPQYDVIYARDFHATLIALLPRIFHHKRLVYEINGIASEEQGLKGNSILNRMLVLSIREAEKFAARWADKIISVTPYMAAYLTNRYHCRPDKIEIVSNGVNLNRFRPIEDKTLLKSYRERLGISSEDLVVLFLGNLNLTQGVEDLIQVVPSLIKQVAITKLLIVGDGILKDEFKREVDRLGVSEHVVFTGMVDYDEVPVYVNLADVCVVLKKKMKSGWSPIKVFEYLACGKPVLSSRVEGLEFIAAEGVGRLTEPGNLRSIEEELLKLLKNPEERIEMGQKGVKLIKGDFDWDSKVNKIEEILRDLA
jgi:glycosyltransferase involved in cell wall biosynthesis